MEKMGFFKIEKFSKQLASIYEEGPEAQEKAFISTPGVQIACRPHVLPHQEALRG